MPLTALDFVFFGISLAGLFGEYIVYQSDFRPRRPLIYYVRLGGWPATWARRMIASDLSLAAVVLYVFIRLQ